MVRVIEGCCKIRSHPTIDRYLRTLEGLPARIGFFCFAHCGITQQLLLRHLQWSNYTPPLRKQTTSTTETQYTSEWSVLKILDHLDPITTGLDGIPAWFLRLGAPVFCQQITHLFNLSPLLPFLFSGKKASILPIPEVCPPMQHADFRPISITPVLTRVMERTVVHHFL